MTATPYFLTPALVERLDIIGDRWTLLILRDCFLNRNSFADFRKWSGIGKATLSRRLKELVREGFLEARKPAGSRQTRYHLTPQATSLFPAALLAWQWETDQIIDQSSLPLSLHHRDCGKETHPVAVCAHCQDDMGLVDITWPDRPSLDYQIAALMQLDHSRRRQRDKPLPGHDPKMATIADLIGNRWTLLILIASFIGCTRFDDYEKTLGIAPNVLSDRLAMLADNGIFDRVAYQHRPLRHDYRLTGKGRALFPLVMLLRQWATACTPDYQEILHHKSCGKALHLSVHCSACDGQLTLDNVIFTH